ncbi:hypothetical protein C1645_732957 [Glomus cerebriforme]|uniref:Uncharacterized protein n=1 Tax=Glomus cerebriforme TaxID=658196 RepID=A0A397TK03_9GLOM|nr:hypothetical protein C1645_732957 [Glomus cerebriforme]
MGLISIRLGLEKWVRRKKYGLKVALGIITMFKKFKFSVKYKKKLNYSRIMGHFKQVLNYSLDDDDEKNLDDMILSYIAKKIEERESKCQTATEESQPSNNTVKLHDGHVYNVNDIKDPIVCRGKGRPSTK